MVESVGKTSAEVPQPVIIRGAEMDFSIGFSHIMLSKEGGQESDAKLVSCGHFCMNDKPGFPVYAAEVRMLYPHLNIILFLFCF